MPLVSLGGTANVAVGLIMSTVTDGEPPAKAMTTGLEVIVVSACGTKLTVPTRLMLFPFLMVTTEHLLGEWSGVKLNPDVGDLADKFHVTSGHV